MGYATIDNTSFRGIPANAAFFFTPWACRAIHCAMVLLNREFVAESDHGGSALFHTRL